MTNLPKVEGLAFGPVPQGVPDPITDPGAPSEEAAPDSPPLSDEPPSAATRAPDSPTPSDEAPPDTASPPD
jgi:hypothetical protein